MNLSRDLFNLIIEKRFFTLDEQGVKLAIQKGNLPFLKAAYKLQIPAVFSSRNIIEATIVGNFEIVKWLYEWCPESHNVTPLNWAAYHGNLPLVKWLHGENCKHHISTFPIDAAAEQGHFEIFVWLYKNCGKCSHHGVLSALKYNRREIIDWLKNNDPELINAAKKLYSEGYFVGFI